MITNPTAQRALRGHLPQRPTPRTATTGKHHAHLATRLTPRDRWLARMLHEHKVFTTGQIVALCYPTMRAANHRLLALYKWRVLDRFQPFLGCGTAQMHYVLDIAGSALLAYEDGLDPRQLGYRHEDAIGIAHSLRLAHTVGVNAFFAALVALSRHSYTCGRLTAWWSELRCNRLFGDMVRPDAYGRWSEHDHQIEFFFEFDFGTEDLGKLSSKLHGYEKLARTTGIITPVLMWLPTNRRETTARRALIDTLSNLDQPRLVPVATTAADIACTPGDNNPTAARWLPLSGPPSQRSGRLRLIELAQLWPHTATSQTPVAAPLPANPQTCGHLTPPVPLPPASSIDRFRG